MAGYSAGAQTKKQIIDVCKRLFYSGGFDETRFADICRTAGVNPGTIAYHFGKKETIALDIYMELLEKVNGLVYGGRDEDYCNRFVSYILWFHVLYDDRQIRRFVKQVQYQRITDEIMLEMQINDFDKYKLDCTPEHKKMIAYAIIGIDNEIMSCLDEACFSDREKTIKFLIMSIFSFVFSDKELAERTYQKCMDIFQTVKYDIRYFRNFKYDKRYLIK